MSRLRFVLSPTPAMIEEAAFVDQCAWCGVLVEVPKSRAEVKKLGACPACGGTQWWHEDIPVGPFQDARYARRILEVDSEDLVGMTEIADRADVKLDTVLKWRIRYEDFPAPLIDLAAGPIWNWPDVKSWLRRSGRIPGGS